MDYNRGRGDESSLSGSALKRSLGTTSAVRQDHLTFLEQEHNAPSRFGSYVALCGSFAE